MSSVIPGTRGVPPKPATGKFEAYMGKLARRGLERVLVDAREHGSGTFLGKALTNFFSRLE